MATNPRIATTTPTMSCTCKTCKRWGPPYPFCAQSAPHPSPQESDLKDEDWNDDRQRVREEDKKEQQRKEEEKNKVLNDYYPASPVYDCTYKQGPLPHCGPREKQALNPNYYPSHYVQEEKHASLVDSLITPPVKEEDWGEKEKKEEKKNEEEANKEEEEDRRKDSDEMQLHSCTYLYNYKMWKLYCTNYFINFPYVPIMLITTLFH